MRRNPNNHADSSLRDAVDVTRYWSLVDKRGDDDCWLWLGDADDNGYGLFVWHGKRTGAHELAVSFSTGEVRGPKLDTCHRCDNPPCCNPRHVRFDTRQGNVDEMHDRGRAGRQGRLTDAQIVEIRERRAAGARQIDLAAQYGISDGQVSMIVRGKRWPQVGGPIETERQYRNVR